MTQRIAVVGMGADGMAGLGAEARALVAGAALLAGGRRHLGALGEHPAPRLAIEGDLQPVLAAIDRASRQGRVVVLASGDPNFFGIASLLRRELGPERVRVVPHLSSVQLAFARIGESWQDARFLSAHGRPLEPVLQQAPGARKLAILTDHRHSAAVVARALLGVGLEAGCRAYICERLGALDEHVWRGTLAEAADAPADALSLLVILRDAATGGRSLRFGQEESLFAHRGGQITKAEVRAVVLAGLRLRPFGVLWDLGSGSGSVAIEAAGLAPQAEVYAVERDAGQLDLLRENVRRHLAANVRIVAGEAPKALAGLPDPHSIFVGGSGGSIAEILGEAARRLRPQGRIVANFALLDHLVRARDLLRGAGFEPQISELTVARGLPAAGGTRLRSENPVFILTAERMVKECPSSTGSALAPGTQNS